MSLFHHLQMAFGYATAVGGALVQSAPTPGLQNAGLGLASFGGVGYVASVILNNRGSSPAP